MSTKKPKKNIKQFKQALLSHTDFIKQSDVISDNKQDETVVTVEVIEDDIRRKFKILANFEKVDEKELINKALNHYLRLKGLQLEQALKELGEQ